MPENHCFICASNEGIFLDIFTGENKYQKNIEMCLSLKMDKKEVPSRKICHKCAYELDECSKFVANFKKTHKTEKGKLYRKRGYCSLCKEYGKKGCIFNLRNENGLENTIEKLHQLFELDFMTEDLCNLSICLDCRYNLDVLFDLTYLFKDVSCCVEDILNGDMASSELPKINTCVVRRKTTLSRMSKLSISQSSLVDSDASTVIIDDETSVRASHSKKLSSHDRKCDECNIKMDIGVDMYRYHHSGNTVCKECWLTMDPYEKTNDKARNSSNKEIETKLCSVFLKDIMIDTLARQKNIDQEIICITSSDETDIENDDKISTQSTKIKRKANMNRSKLAKKSKLQNVKATKLTRSNSVQSINVVNKKITRQTRSESAEISDYENKNRRKRAHSIAKSVASTSKSTEGKKLREFRSRIIIPKKRKTDKSNLLSNNGGNNTIASKVRRLSSPTFKIDSNDSKSDTDSDNNRPYTCKICLNEFENKIVGLTHELIHSNKLEVMLNKVTLPDIIEDNEINEKQSSIEFDSPVRSHGEQTDSDYHLAVTDDSTLREFSDLPHDNTDHNNQSMNSTIVSLNLTRAEDKGDKEEEMEKEKIEENDTQVNSSLVCNDKVSNVDEQPPPETTELNINRKIMESDEKEPCKNIDDDENNVLADKNDKEIENKIGSEITEDNFTSEENKKNIKSSEINKENDNENEKESVPQCEIVSNETLTDEPKKNDYKEDDKEHEKSDDNNEEVIKSKKTDDKKKDNNENIEQNNEEIIESNNSIKKNHNENVDKTLSSNEDNDDETEITKYSNESNKSKECFNADVNNASEEIDNIKKNEASDVPPFTEAEGKIEDTVIDTGSINNETKRGESMDNIEEKLAEMMGGNQIEEPKIIVENICDEIIKTEGTLSLESTTKNTVNNTES